MKPLPVGKQDFQVLQTQGFLYVDKTRFLRELALQTTPFFLSRPRRFGKSLTVSKLYYLFTGQRELFRGTYIHDHWDWKPHPVIRLSLNEVDTRSPGSVEESLVFLLKKTYEEYGIQPRTENLKLMFSDLIQQLSREEKVVVLIDEYDKPMLDNLSHLTLADEIRQVLRLFYGTLKDADPYLRFLFLTGITKFTKTGVFSTLNNLNDISSDPRFAQMFGYTQQELERDFSEHIEQGVSRLQLPRKQLVDRIQQTYYGFSFDGEHFVYNPFSVLNFFDKYAFGNYWVQSGSPSFLVQYAKQHHLKPSDYLGTYVDENLLIAYEIEQAPPISFLLQSGYLTFKGKDERKGYLVDYPNTEVRDSFSKLLLLGSFNQSPQVEQQMRNRIIDAFAQRDFPTVFREMNRTLSLIPHVLFEKKSSEELQHQWIARNENFYHSVILTLFWACGLDVRAEQMTSRGRSDLVLRFDNDVYVMELKIAPAQQALEQVKTKGYAEPFVGQNVFLVGIQIDQEKRCLSQYVLKEQTPSPTNE
ncbi:MAG TPA: AAA family ATPase [Thermotogota bacterium]|nr:AAA family ATPase [Thermotogota bacterium]